MVWFAVIEFFLSVIQSSSCSCSNNESVIVLETLNMLCFYHLCNVSKLQCAKVCDDTVAVLHI